MSEQQGRAGSRTSRGRSPEEPRSDDEAAKRRAAANGTATVDRLLGLALEAGQLGAFEIDLAEGTVARPDGRHDAIFGYDQPQPKWCLATTREHLLAEDQPTFDAALERALKTGDLRFEARLRRHGDEDLRWIATLGRTVDDEAGRAVRITGVVQDITETKRAEEHERVLLAELQHRVRNTLAMIRAVARRTSEGREDFDDFIAHLSARIGALARVQGMATRWPWAGVGLAELVAEELNAHLAREGEQVLIEGPNLSLPLRTGELLGLALHELTVNSVKFGALATPGGRIEVRWRIDSGTGGPRLRLEWEEHGVRLDPGAERRYGFGRELIERALGHELGAAAELVFCPDGVHCAIALPLEAERG